MNTRAEVMAKVRRLFALADRAGTPGEAAAAASRAQALLDRWEMTRDEAEAGDADEMVSTLDVPNGWIDTEPKITLWKHHLIAGLCVVNGCAGFRSNRGRGQSYEVSGRRAAVEIVRMLYGWLSKEIKKISRAKRAGLGKHYADSFRFGMVELVILRLQSDQRLEFERQKAAAFNPAALVKVNEAVARVENSKKAEQWMMDRPGIQVDEGRPAFEMPDPIARIDGAAHGARMDLSGPAPRLDPRRQR
jgi:hypothetical protein